MTILALVVWVVVLGLVAWLVNSYMPIPQPFKTIINVVLIIVALYLVLTAFGLLGALQAPVPRVR